MSHVAVLRLGALVLAAGLVACDGKATSPSRAEAGRGNVAAPARAAVPRLVDLGAGKCIPCKEMAPILAQLRTDYAGRLDVVFIDVWERPEEARAYRVVMIPTQIFYAADGREVARHEGFIDREAILAKWKALGVEL
jgi:thioredoxin 1